MLLLYALTHNSQNVLSGHLTFINTVCIQWMIEPLPFQVKCCCYGLPYERSFLLNGFDSPNDIDLYFQFKTKSHATLPRWDGFVLFKWYVCKSKRKVLVSVWIRHTSPTLISDTLHAHTCRTITKEIFNEKYYFTCFFSLVKRNTFIKFFGLNF